MKSINRVTSGSGFIHDAPMLCAPRFLETGTARQLKALTRFRPSAGTAARIRRNRSPSHIGVP